LGISLHGGALLLPEPPQLPLGEEENLRLWDKETSWTWHLVVTGFLDRVVHMPQYLLVAKRYLRLMEEVRVALVVHLWQGSILIAHSWPDTERLFLWLLSTV
jgi:hypothetical protein